MPPVGDSLTCALIEHHLPATVTKRLRSLTSSLDVCRRAFLKCMQCHASATRSRRLDSRRCRWLTISRCLPPVRLAHPESREEGQGGCFQVHDSVPGPQPEDAGAVQPCKQPLWVPNGQIPSSIRHMLVLPFLYIFYFFYVYFMFCAIKFTLFLTSHVIFADRTSTGMPTTCPEGSLRPSPPTPLK